MLIYRVGTVRIVLIVYCIINTVHHKYSTLNIYALRGLPATVWMTRSSSNSSCNGMQDNFEPMAQFGITMDMLLRDFWEWYGKQLGCKWEPVCSKIADHLAENYGCVTVGCMLELTGNEIKSSVTDCGGNTPWLRSIERLLHHKFDFSIGAPPSAQLLTCSSMTTLKHHLSPQEHLSSFVDKDNEKLGDMLERTGLMNDFQLPMKIIMERIEETKDWRTHKLSYNDCKGVTDEIFKYIFCRYGQVGCCSTLFKKIDKMLLRAGLVPGPDGWVDKLRWRFHNGRKALKHGVSVLMLMLMLPRQ